MLYITPERSETSLIVQPLSAASSRIRSLIIPIVVLTSETVEVAPPSDKDFAFWWRRWKKRQQRQKKPAPPFWVQFFAQQFHQSPSVDVLSNWGELIRLIKFAFGEGILQELREKYRQEKALLSF